MRNLLGLLLLATSALSLSQTGPPHSGPEVVSITPQYHDAPTGTCLLNGTTLTVTATSIVSHTDTGGINLHSRAQVDWVVTVRERINPGESSSGPAILRPTLEWQGTVQVATPQNPIGTVHTLAHVSGPVTDTEVYTNLWSTGDNDEQFGSEGLPLIQIYLYGSSDGYRYGTGVVTGPLIAADTEAFVTYAGDAGAYASATESYTLHVSAEDGPRLGGPLPPAHGPL